MLKFFIYELINIYVPLLKIKGLRMPSFISHVTTYYFNFNLFFRTTSWSLSPNEESPWEMI